MHILVELWSVEPAWRALSRAERERFMAGVGESMTELAAAGIEPVAWSRAEPYEDADHEADCEFFAVWRMPGPEQADLFRRTVAASGWYGYFRHVNVAGEQRTPDAVIAEHLDA